MLKYDKIKPLLSRVLVKKIENPTKTAGGVLLPNQGVNSRIGCVLDTGNGKTTVKGDIIKPSLQVGQFVLLPEYGGVRVPTTNEKEELFIFQEDDILGVVEGSFNKKI
jgi:chaperonin GroES